MELCWSSLCRPVRNSEEPLSSWAYVLGVFAGRGSCLRSAVLESGRNDVIDAGAEGMKGEGDTDVWRHGLKKRMPAGHCPGAPWLSLLPANG